MNKTTPEKLNATNISDNDISHLETLRNAVNHNTIDTSSSSSAGNVLKELRIRSFNRIIIGHLKINSLRNKVEFLSDQIKGNIHFVNFGNKIGHIIS